MSGVPLERQAGLRTAEVRDLRSAKRPNGQFSVTAGSPGFSENGQEPFVADFSLFLQGSAAAPCPAVGARARAAL